MKMAPGMNTDRMDTDPEADVRQARRKYAALLRLYPAHYRSNYGAPIMDTLLDQYRSLPQKQRHSYSFWVLQAVDLGRNALSVSVRLWTDRLMARPPIPAGSRIGGCVGICFAAGAATYDLTPWLSGLSESVSDGLCLVLFASACLLAGWTAARSKRLSSGVMAGIAGGGLIAGLTGLAYLLVDQLFAPSPSQQHEKYLAFVQSHAPNVHIYFLLSDLRGLGVLLVAGLASGAVLGIVGQRLHLSQGAAMDAKRP